MSCSTYWRQSTEEDPEQSPGELQHYNSHPYFVILCNFRCFAQNIMEINIVTYDSSVLFKNNQYLFLMNIINSLTDDTLTASTDKNTGNRPTSHSFICYNDPIFIFTSMFVLYIIHKSIFHIFMQLQQVHLLMIQVIRRLFPALSLITISSTLQQ